MHRLRRGALLISVLAGTAAPSWAQANAWHNIAVPAATFEIAGLTANDDRAQRTLRLIRRLYSVPSGHRSVDALQTNLAAFLTDINALLDAVDQLPDGTLTLAGADARQTRQALAAMGLRVADRNGSAVVERAPDGDAAARRERFVTAGIDTASTMEKLNARESVRLAPVVVEVPLPLSAETWASVVFGEPLRPRTLFSRILGDRSASLLYYGLCGVTPETRAFLQRTPDLLRWIYRERSGTFAAFGSSIRVANGAIDLPGGEPARHVWEALIGASASVPVEFIKQVLSRDDGRLAYLYESVDMLDAPRQRFALGLAIPGASERVERFRALHRAFVGIEAQWSHLSVPFARPMHDAAMLLQVARVTPDGRLAEPALRGLWRRAFESADFPDDPARTVRDASAEGVLDAAGVAELVVLAPATHRRERFEAFAFGQRVFTGSPHSQLGDVLVALRGFARFPALMLTLDRLGLTSPPLYASIARHAAAIESVDDPNVQIPLQAQFQGAVGLIDRLERTGGLASGALEPLLASLVAASPTASHGYAGHVAKWIDTRLLPSLRMSAPHAAAGVEGRLLASLADAEHDAGRPFEWEGVAYEVNIATAETMRIEAIRARQGGNSLDAVLAFARDVARLADHSFAVADVKPMMALLKGHAARLGPARRWPGMKGDEVPDVRAIVNRALRDLGKIRRPRHASKAAGIGVPLTGAADYFLGEVLVALVYAPLLGDPANLIGDADVAHNHDFGAGTAVTADARTRTPWVRPRQPAGVTVVGAVLGLDLALAHHGLRRLTNDRVPELPRLNTNNREVFATSVALMNPRQITEADIRSTAASLRAGRGRVLAAASDVTLLDRLAASARMSASRRQLLAWAATHDQARVPDLFSMSELLAIGDATQADTSRESLGLTEEPLTGCYCRRFPSPGPWEPYSGRLGSGQLATRVPDLTLRVAELLDELSVPASLLPSVLSLATQDFIDEVPALYADDWAAAIAQARSVSRERVEDYVASLTASGPLRPLSSNKP